MSTLHVKGIDLVQATAIVLGAEIGTTFKLFFASFKSAPIKKRLALANLLYNVVVIVIVFPILRWIDHLIVHRLAIADPLIALAFFQTFINLFGILLFAPVIRIWSGFVQRFYTKDGKQFRYIDSVPPTELEFALVASQRESLYFLRCAIYFSEQVLGLVHSNGQKDIPKQFLEMDEMEQYQHLKHLHGGIFN